MHIVMLQTRRGSEDGHVVRCFQSGHSYALADTLARDFIRRGWAAEIPSSGSSSTHQGIPP